ncbi:F0F1 ATP synthase subunit delta [Horticoccus luteus]|uniref:F0F1 ATP synthase subunit delta n=1 Tax=Horticoccus luteus TaxID=2862869 RepID=A0A8F9TVF1_9BACT|nr:F0F1 ATP synthase subunit delta [Horticoccus luteus]QYM79018.1 F0F1 ATP synthase subunit delta [Horticoccus luteus]
MAARGKHDQHLVRQLFRLSFAHGELSAERVSGVLAYIEKHPPTHPLALLKAYHRLIAAELAKQHAVIEHAGPISAATTAAIAAAMSKRYGRTITATPKPQSNLLAGLRVQVGDDVYEASISNQLAGLASAV